MHVYTPAQRDAPTNMINNAICVGAVHKLRFAQDLILYNLALSEEIEGFEGSAHKADLAGGPDLAADARAGRGPDRHPRLVGGVLRHDGRLRAAGRRAVPLGLRHAGRRAPGRLRDADDHGRRRVRRGARAARRARAVPDAGRRRGARRRPTRRPCRAGSTSTRRRPSTPPATCSRSGRSSPRRSSRFEDSFDRSRGRFEELCSVPRPRDPEGGHGMSAVRLRSHVLQQGGRDADEQPGRLRRGQRDARQGEHHDHRAARR